MAKEMPTIMVELRGGNITPLSQLDAELLDSFHGGEMFRLEYAARRSNPQNSLYWVMLQRVVDATGQWASSRTLHRQCLLECGFVTPVVSLDGKSVRLEPDSTAFNSMSARDFKTYFDKAVALITQATGIDPLAFYRDEEAA